MKKSILALTIFFLLPYFALSKEANYQKDYVTKKQEKMIYQNKSAGNPYLRKLQNYADKDPYNIKRSPAGIKNRKENEIYYHWDLGMGM